MLSEIRPIGNALLRNMSKADFALLSPHLEYKALALRFYTEHAGKPIQNMYFIEGGLCSVTSAAPSGRETEVGMIGYEGLTGAAIILGALQSPHSSFMQVAGSGYEINARVLTKAMEASGTLRAALVQYAQGLTIQVASTALANAQAPVSARLARWLLMIDDRIAGVELAITHELLGIMLGTRRPHITDTLNALEGDGAIKAKRGRITVVNRKLLVDAACGFYGQAEKEYRRLLKSTETPWSLEKSRPLRLER
jgi:CRP-like cAMP-binding protein